MSHPYLPIIGPNSQPGESDGAELDYLRMPSEMSIYTAPDVPEAEEVRGLDQAMAVLEQLLNQLRDHDQAPAQAIALNGMDVANRRLLDQVLGEGEVSIVVEGDDKWLIQESVLAGVWRVQSIDEAGLVTNDEIEVATVPWVVREMSFKNVKGSVSFDSTILPPGVMNAPPLLAEIDEQIPRINQSGGSHAINLSLLPQTEEDLAFLQVQLGSGRVVILSRGYGNCRITSTNTKNVWWVQYFNSQDSVILNTLEISSVPEVACAAAEDIEDSAQRLNEILEVYRT